MLSGRNCKARTRARHTLLRRPSAVQSNSCCPAEFRPKVLHALMTGHGPPQSPASTGPPAVPATDRQAPAVPTGSATREPERLEPQFSDLESNALPTEPRGGHCGIIPRFDNKHSTFRKHCNNVKLLAGYINCRKLSILGVNLI